jgi:hypothetical protein
MCGKINDFLAPPYSGPGYCPQGANLDKLMEFMNRCIRRHSHVQTLECLRLYPFTKQAV